MLVAIFVPLILFAAARISLKSEWLRTKVISYASETVYSMTGATLEVGAHRGDLLRGIELEGVALVKGDTLVRADRVAVDYALWPMMSRSVLIDRLHIDGLILDLEQDSSGTFNIESLVPEADITQSDAEPWIVAISDIQLRGGKVVHRTYSDSIADTAIFSEILAAGSFRTNGTTWAGSLRTLELKAEHKALQDAMGVSLSADADSDQITLTHLLLSYGESAAKVAGTYIIASDSLDFHLQLDPLAATDINRYIDPIARKNLDVVLSASGTTQGIQLGISVLDGSRNVADLGANLHLRDGLYGLVHLSATSAGFRLGEFVMIPDLQGVSFRDASATFTGWMPLDGNAPQGDVAVSVSQLQMDAYRIGKIDASFTTDDTMIRRSDGFDGLAGRFEGVATDVFVDGQRIDRINTRGRLQRQLHIDALALQLGRGLIRASGTTSLDFELPVYEFDVVARGVDLSVIEGFEELRTDLNATMSISGVGISEANREININLAADSSWVNQTQIDQLDAVITLVRDRAFVEDAQLSSAIADGQFRGEIVIDDMFRPTNNLVFELNVKNLQPLAAFAGVETLGATGQIRGRVEEGAVAPELIAIVALDDIAVDSITVERVVGQYVMAVQTNPTYQAELDLISPNINGTPIDDVRFVSRGVINGVDVSGQFGVDLNVHESTGVSLQGLFTATGDSLRVQTSEFDLRGPTRTYRQASEFGLSYFGGVLTTDVLEMTSEPDAKLMLQISHASADSVQLWLDMRQVSLEALQAGLMSDPVLAGTMTGRVDVFYAADRLILDTDIELISLAFEEFELDRMSVNAKLDEELLTGTLSAWHKGVELAAAEVELPFKLGDPGDFDTEFYERPVKARISADSLNTSIFSGLLERFDLPDITGIVNLDMDLRGTAGEPVLQGGLWFAAGTIGGIPVDRLNLGWKYDQANSKLVCSADLTATGQQVFTSIFDLPFVLDLRNFEKILPEETAPISGNLTAAGFDLALVSQFLPPDYADQLVGTIDGDVDVRGTVGSPSFDGQLSLRNAGIHLVPNNVTLRSMGGMVVFNRDRILLESFTVRSGTGDLTGSGFIQMDGFNPRDVSIGLRARQFLISDTRDMRAVASLDGNIGGTLFRPDLTGSMIVNSANIYLDNFGEKTVEEVQLDGDEPLQAPSIYDSLSVRMRVQVDPNVWVRNRTSPELAIEVQGDMDLLKDRGSDLMAFGSLATRQGYAMQYGKRFQMERGQLAFSGDPFNPRLDIVSLYELRVPEDIEIRYLITGTVNEPEFNFSSNPEMELENIISYTLFGKPFGALFSWQQTFSGGGGGGALARDAAIGVLVDRVESLATESLGIDMLQIDSNRQGETVTTSVKAGKYITDKLFVAVLNELGGSDAVTRVVLEYYIRRNLLLMLTQGNDRRSGIDLLWKYEY